MRKKETKNVDAAYILMQSGLDGSRRDLIKRHDLICSSVYSFEKYESDFPLDL